MKPLQICSTRTDPVLEDDVQDSVYTVEFPTQDRFITSGPMDVQDSFYTVELPTQDRFITSGPEKTTTLIVTENKKSMVGQRFTPNGSRCRYVQSMPPPLTITSRHRIGDHPPTASICYPLSAALETPASHNIVLENPNIPEDSRVQRNISCSKKGMIGQIDRLSFQREQS